MNRLWIPLIAVALILSAACPALADDKPPPAPKAEEPAPPPSLQTDQPVSIALSSKVPFKFYGFVSGEFLWTGSQLSTFGTLDNTPASYNRQIAGFNRVVDESIDGNNDAAVSGTVQNTRFGFALDRYDFNGKNYSVDARIEMDFFSATNTNIGTVVPRLRRAYASIGQDHWRFLAGQEWDLFSPLNPSTLNLGGNLWTQGNLGFRRPQLRFGYEHTVGDQSGLEGAASLNLPSNVMSLDDNGNSTGIPMFEGRVGFWHTLPAGKMWAYLSAAYAQHRNAVAGASRVNNWGLGLSLDVPVHRLLKPMGEVHYGYSLGSELSIASDTRRQRTLSAWGQIKSEWLSWLETNIGYGIDTLSSPQVPANSVKRNQMGFGNILFKPFKVFVIGLEYNYLRTTYQGTGPSEANVGFTNVLFYF